MATRSDERSTISRSIGGRSGRDPGTHMMIAKAGVETGAKMLGVSIALCTLVGASKVHANAKGLV